MSDWIILRTSSRTTMRLAESLAKDGFEVWTPIEHRTIRVPRMNARRPVRLPIMPSYVFARVKHLVDLLELAAMPVKPRRGAGLREPAHAGFSVVHWRDKIPAIPDEHFAELRKIEARRTPTPKAERVLPIGAKARVLNGICGGMKGVVEQSNRRTTTLRCDDKFVMKFATCILELTEVSNYPSVALAA